MRFYSTMAAAFLTSFVTAAPTAHVQRSIKLTQCPLSNANDVSLPAAASTVGMSLFEGEKPVHVLLGRGVQNYTCTNGVYASNMAVADLFDASCAAANPILSRLPQLALLLPYSGQLSGLCKAIIGSFKIGDHYFQKLTPSASSANPVFDLRATGRGSYAAFKRDASIPDPTDPSKNIAWLQLSAVEGDLAKHVYRTSTAGGVPPSTCDTEGKVIKVDYAALYYLYK